MLNLALYVLVFGFQLLFCVPSLSLAQKTFLEKVGTKLFWKCCLRILREKKNAKFDLKYTLNKICF